LHSANAPSLPRPAARREGEVKTLLLWNILHPIAKIQIQNDFWDSPEMGFKNEA
jgi:hypothetical protein